MTTGLSPSSLSITIFFTAAQLEYNIVPKWCHVTAPTFTNGDKARQWFNVATINLHLLTVSSRSYSNDALTVLGDKTVNDFIWKGRPIVPLNISSMWVRSHWQHSSWPVTYLSKCLQWKIPFNYNITITLRVCTLRKCPGSCTNYSGQPYLATNKTPSIPSPCHAEDTAWQEEWISNYKRQNFNWIESMHVMATPSGCCCSMEPSPRQ